MNYVTAEGMKKMIDKLNDLKFKQRPAATERLNEARKHGDLRENGDYKAAKEEIAQIDSRIGHYEMLIADSEVIKDEDITTDSVSVLNSVLVKDHTRNREIEYHLVSKDEADPLEFKLSAESPIGKALLGKKVGDLVEVKIPVGTIELEVLNIS